MGHLPLPVELLLERNRTSVEVELEDEIFRSCKIFNINPNVDLKYLIIVLHDDIAVCSN